MVQRLKNSFVCNLFSLAKSSIVVGPLTKIIDLPVCAVT